MSVQLCLGVGLLAPTHLTLGRVDVRNTVAVAFSDSLEWCVHRRLELDLVGRESRGRLCLVCKSGTVVEELHGCDNEELENRTDFELPLALPVALLDELLELLFIQLVHEIADTEVAVIRRRIGARQLTAERHILHMGRCAEQISEQIVSTDMGGKQMPVGPAVAAISCSCSCSGSCRRQLLHPLKVVRIMDDAIDNRARNVGERRIALRAEHLVTAAHLGNRRAAAGAGATVLDDFGDGSNQRGVAHVLDALHLPFTAIAAELGRTCSTLVGRAQESTAALNGTGGYEQSLFLGFVGRLWSVADVAPVTLHLALDIAQHSIQMGFLCGQSREFRRIDPLLELDLHIGLRHRQQRTLTVEQNLLTVETELSLPPTP